MNRNLFRALGVLLGLFAGTMGSMVSIQWRRAARPPQYSEQALDVPDATSQPAVDAPAPDPGDRRRLLELRQAVANEPNWTRTFSLTERSGRMVKSDELLGEPYVVCFFFSTCPGTCKRQSSEMRLLQSKFKDRPIKLVSISVDPEVDTPEVLTEYANAFNADKDRWLFLTGSLDDIIKVGTEMFFLPGVERRGHPDRFCLVDAKGDLVGSYLWVEPEQRELLSAHIEELLASP
ncbi:MAG: SCO family protein [Planctomycetota bacterium]